MAASSSSSSSSSPDSESLPIAANNFAGDDRPWVAGTEVGAGCTAGLLDGGLNPVEADPTELEPCAARADEGLVEWERHKGLRLPAGLARDVMEAGERAPCARGVPYL